MTTDLQPSRIQAALDRVVARLVGAMHPDGYWEGHLSSSALSTATAVSALALARTSEDAPRIQAGVEWLKRTQNADGGWGDTTDSPSNLSTTLLAVSAIRLASSGGEVGGDSEERRRQSGALQKADAYISKNAGATASERIAAITRAYGKDRTFAVPILMNGALAGLFPWDEIPDLPFELAAFPNGMYRALRLQVVSYALPALIAIGLLLHERKSKPFGLRRWFREAVTSSVLSRLATIQPSSGGFLEATPLTSFVAMSLIARYGPEQPVACRCLEFLRRSARADGSWPIDSNLSVWLTTGAVNALARANRLKAVPVERIRAWLRDRQYREAHPFTAARPGGWAWTHLPGGVPDADDTSGALLALVQSGETEKEILRNGVLWLLGLQNADGGWPTFCRGWNRLPFDQSAPDVTAHALSALHATAPFDRPVKEAIQRGTAYLARTQRDDGAWLPLWFGNQSTTDGANPVLGTARVLASAPVWAANDPAMLQKGVRYLVSVQNPDGGWGGANAVASTIEETALAVAALASPPSSAGTESAVTRGAEYLCRRLEEDRWGPATPIGLYFAKLWYSEELYRDIWALQALGEILTR